MVRSMTGFGKTVLSGNGASVTVEIQSVNGRFLEVKTKIPKYLNAQESLFREIVQSFVSRGRVSVTMTVDCPELRLNEFSVDFDLAGKYLEIADELSSRYGIENRIDTRTLLMLPNLITTAREEQLDSSLPDLAQSALKSALVDHRAMREREGEAMARDISARIGMVVTLCAEIEREAPRAVSDNTRRLKQKIQSLIDNGQFDETRFAMEVSLYADRVDITEECVRFKSHAELFGREMTGDTVSGKKLSFLLQEMNREANTVASKSQDAMIAQTVVRIKEELEKMREQVENME